MKMTKRILSLVLCLVMLVGLMPAITLNADAAEEPIDAAVIFSDLHTSWRDDKQSTVTGIMNAVSGLPVSSVTGAGDMFSVNEYGFTEDSTANITGYIRGELGDIPVNYVWSDHDRMATDISKESGFVYGAGSDGIYGTADDGNYYIYALSMADIGTNDRYNAGFSSNDEVTAVISDFTAGAAKLDQTKPLFVASHMPLLDRRNDNGHAYEWATAINAVAQSMDVAFFFGHNHNHDEAKDYYYAKGSTMSVCSDSSGNAKDVVLNFTHICAGYMAPASTGSTSNTTREGVAVAISIYADSINYTTYNASGVYTGNYALNETVKREFAKTEPEVPATSEPTEPETSEPSVPETSEPSVPETSEPVTTEPEIVEKTHEATGVTVAARGITGLSVNVVTDPIYDTNAYSAYASFDITVEGHVDGVEATVTLPAPAGFDAEKPVVILYEGEVIATTSIVEGKIRFTTDHFSVYDAAQTAEGDLNWIHISTSTGESYYELATSVESGATYLIASGASNSVRLLSKSGGRSNSVTVSNRRITNGGADYEWTFTASGNGYTIMDTDGEYLYTNATYSSSWIGGSWSHSLVANGSSANAMTVSVNRSSGAATISRSVTSSSRSTTSYLRYSSGFGASGSSGSLYLFKKVTQPGGSVYAAMDGQTSFTFHVGAYNVDEIHNAIAIYTATDANGTGMTPTNNYELVGAVSGGVAGTYELTVQYGGKELGKITVVMTSDPYLKITENGEEAELIFKKNVLVNDTVQLGVKAFNGTTMEGNPNVAWEIPEEYAGLASVDGTGKVTFEVDRANFLVKATWTVGDKTLTDTIQIIITPDSYLTPGTSTNDFPEYPNQGAIRYDKTAEAVGNFSETGVTQLELSMTGIPFSAPKTLDVVLMLDHSNSMTDDRMKATRAAVEVFVNNIVKNADGSFNGNRIYIGSFAGGNPDYAGQSRHEFRINKMTTNEEDGFQIINDQDELDALIETVKTVFVKPSNPPYGTEYDLSLEDCYNVLSAVKADGHQQFCVFMSDGIPNVYRYGAGTNDRTTSSSAMANLFTPTSGTSGTRYTSRGSSYKYEYWSSLMKQEGVTVFAVGLGLHGTNSSLNGANEDECERVSNMLLNDISGPAGETAADRDTGNTVSKLNKYFFSVADANAAEDMENVFTNIASQIMLAATDIVVTDKIANEYTMIFGVPKSAGDDEKAAERNAAVAAALANYPLYIEVVNYTLDAQHERTETVDTLTRVYLTDSNGAAAGGTYSAATDANGTAAAAPTFTAAAEGKRGYWSQFSGTAGEDDIIIKVGDTTWKFMEKGDGTHNVTAGAYAYGNIDAKTNMSEDLVIVTPYFAYSAKTKMLAWTADKVEEFKELALRYFLYLDGSSTEIGTSNETDPGTYVTNEWAYMTYVNHLGNECRREYPVPQMTWNGAQVSYVFYLVNENGEPINKAGERVDFANATFITDIFTESVVWNDTDTPTQEGRAYLEAEWMAKDKLPTGYTLYDEEAYYELKVYEDHEGNILDNYFMIDGSEANGTAESTTKVYNTKAGVKHSAYGTYTSKESANFDDEKILENFDFANTTVAFAVVWKLQMNPDTVVVDYGLDVLINVVENDLMANTLTGISKNERGNLAINTGIAGNSAFTSQTLDYTDYVFSVEGENQIRFHQKNMQFKAPVTIYYETKSTDYINGTARTGYMYSSLTVIPATTIYYEDTFVTLSSYTKVGDDFVKDDNTAWVVEGTNISSVQQQDRPGASQISAALDADNNYGYDAAYKNMSTYSMGASRKITLTPGHDGQADFDFYGTGFDVISLTSNMTGTIVVEMYNYAENTDYKDAAPVKSFVVDTYYGYAYGPFEQTYTYTNGEWVMTEERVDAMGESQEVPADPQEGATYVTYKNKWYTVDSNDPAALYQIPVMKISGLPYGRYHAKIVAFYDEFFDNTGAGSYDFYLDAIRIYDPTGNQNQEANDAYVQDGEGWPTYEEVRNYVIDEQTFNSLENDDEISGIVFIDSNTTGDPEPSIADYTSYGPNNELYLAPGQAITFTMTPGANVAKIQMAMKTVYGTGKVQVYAVENGKKGDVIVSETLSSATDMYYTLWESEIVENQDGNKEQTQAPASMTLVIRNNGDEDAAIISITNVKITHTSAPAARMMMFAVRRPAVEEALATMSVEEDVTEPETQPTEPETEPTEPETEATEPETEPTEPATKPTLPEEEPTEPETEPTEPSVEEKVEEVIREVKKIIKDILGWLFG